MGKKEKSYELRASSNAAGLRLQAFENLKSKCKM